MKDAILYESERKQIRALQLLEVENLLSKIIDDGLDPYIKLGYIPLSEKTRQKVEALDSLLTEDLNQFLSNYNWKLCKTSNDNTLALYFIK